VPAPAKPARRPESPTTDDLHVRVDADPHGGWQVTASAGDRVVSSRHYDDWHRVERARLSLSIRATHEALPAT
jgi:hypothetical protein